MKSSLGILRKRSDELNCLKRLWFELPNSLGHGADVSLEELKRLISLEEEKVFKIFFTATNIKVLLKLWLIKQLSAFCGDCPMKSCKVASMEYCNGLL